MFPYFRNLVVPFGLAVMAGLLTARLGNVWLAYSDLLKPMPYILFVVTALVALYLLQYLYVYTTVLLLLVYYLVQQHLQTGLSEPQTLAVFAWANALFPVLLMATVMTGQRPPKSAAVCFLGAAYLLLPLLPVLVSEASAIRLIEYISPALWLPVFDGSPMARIMLLSFPPVLAFLLALYSLNPSILISQWLTALLTVLGMSLWFDVPLISSVLFSLLAFSIALALLQEAYSLAFMDELTQIPARKALQKQLPGLGRRYAIAMLDVDHFKKFNDTYGHDVGDQVLRMVASKVNRVGGGGRAFRYGGEEFTILFPGKTAQQAVEYLEKVRLAVADYRMQLRDADRPDDDKVGKTRRGGKAHSGVRVTISMGVAERSDDHTTPEEVIKAADKVLYKAKKAGRNCIKGGE